MLENRIVREAYILSRIKKELDFVVGYYMRNNNKKSIKVVKQLMRVREEAKINGFRVKDILIEYIGLLSNLNLTKAKIVFNTIMFRATNYEIEVFKQQIQLPGLKDVQTNAI